MAETFSTPSLQVAPGPVEGEINLSGRRYRLKLSWESRTEGWDARSKPDGAWYVYLAESDGTPLFGRTLMRISDDLWERYPETDATPPGTLRIFRPAGGDALPLLTEIGTAVLIQYLELGEVVPDGG